MNQLGVQHMKVRFSHGHNHPYCTQRIDRAQRNCLLNPCYLQTKKEARCAWLSTALSPRFKGDTAQRPTSYANLTGKYPKFLNAPSLLLEEA